ncbi:helix-turn-helix transcriptional regulator [Protaetiibacter intestinalis]|uniref:WYL domain-containing protein n=1 Tax=Protaetiibacter intestinalis TaxID=2419774 RepID=A0A387B4B1_9MICO|nr:WYL domain-containing protein [Protaetiibacter intestinalis]AYF97253.1 WYL domain-containing protein [Protaetiibacter intestinalis]
MADTTSRMLQLLSLLQARRDWPGELLAERLDVSVRTVRRDVDRLRELGYRVQAVKGPDGGYRLENGSELPPLLFDDEQAVAVAIALQTATASGADIGEAADRALATVRQVMPSRLRHRVDALATTAPPPAADPVDPGVLLAVSEAIRTHEVLRFDYAGGEQPRRTEPHHLVARAGRWYLIGWDLDRDDWRVYRADRIAPRSARGRRFAPRRLPGGDPHALLDARFRGAPEGSGWPARGSAVVALPLADVAPFVGDGEAEALGPDRTRITAGSWSWDALAASFGRFGAALDEPRPAELASAFRRLAARAAAAASPRVDDRDRGPDRDEPPVS